MLETPSSFIPLIAPVDHPAPHTFLFRNGELLVSESDLSLPQHSDCASIHADRLEMHAVGLLDGCYCRTSWLASSVEPPAGFQFKNLRSLFGIWDDGFLAVAGRAFQIADWARTHRFCGACGAAMQAAQGERCFKCPSCAMVAYPRISPAMMVLVKKGDAILLARNVHSPTGRFSPLAGFLEAGESIEDAVHREVFEEVGLKVRDLKYFGSQSWPFPHSLMIAYTAEYASGEIRLDETEIAEARWYGPGDTLPPTAQGISIAGKLIEANLPAARAENAPAFGSV